MRKMASLLDRLKGTDNDPEISPEIPDEIPSEWFDGGPPLTPDPVPGSAKPPRQRLRQATTSGNVTPALKKRISAEVAAYVEFAAIPIVMRDPECGGVLHEQAQPIADAITAILSRYPDLAHKFLQTGVLGDWLKLGVALTPVFRAVWAHHFAVKPDEEEESASDQPIYPAYRPGQ